MRSGLAKRIKKNFFVPHEKSVIVQYIQYYVQYFFFL
jgi:hypothetical protein